MNFADGGAGARRPFGRGAVPGFETLLSS
jgi:hypothetical protein